MYTDFKDVVVCLPRPMEGMGRLQFSDLFTELPVPPHVAGVIGTFFIILSTTVSVIDRKDAILFLQCLFFFCVHLHFFKYTLHVCYIFNVI